LKEQLEILLELQRIDNSIEEEEKKGRELPLKLERIKQEIVELQNYLESKKKIVKDLQIKLSRKELDLSEKSNKIMKHQEDLYGGKITDIKELRQLQSIIETYKEEKRSIEDNLLDLMVEIEDSKKEVDALEEKLFKQKEYLNKCQQEIDLSIAQIKERINYNCDLRKKILEKITDSHLLNEYELLKRVKEGSAIIEVNEPICPGCYLNLPSDTVYQLKKAEIVITCPNCNRILVWKE